MIYWGGGLDGHNLLEFGGGSFKGAVSDAALRRSLLCRA